MLPLSSSVLLTLLIFLGWYTCDSSGKIGGWDTAPNTQYHIQTDEGPERYFRYQTSSGQYRKEKRLQDGSVVGTYGWVDADGFLRLRDYIADDKGYRIVRTKMVRVSGEAPSATTTTTTTPKPPITLSQYLREKQAEDLKVDIVPNGLPASDYVEPTTYRPYYSPNSIDQRAYPSQPQGYQQQQQQGYQQGRVYQQTQLYQEPYSEPALYDQPYDGVSTTQNGFRYYLPRQYHEEETSPDNTRAGSFGYVDPFGIRRVIYYNTSPAGGFVHRKNNRYVGFRSTPYDPRF